MIVRPSTNTVKKVSQFYISFVPVHSWTSWDVDILYSFINSRLQFIFKTRKKKHLGWNTNTYNSFTSLHFFSSSSPLEAYGGIANKSLLLVERVACIRLSSLMFILFYLKSYLPTRSQVYLIRINPPLLLREIFLIYFSTLFWFLKGSYFLHFL